MADTIDKELLENIQGIDLQTLVAAKGIAQRNLLENPTKANFQAFNEASKNLAAATGRSQADTDGGRKFKNRAEALRHLQAKGYKLRKSKFYKDVDKRLCHMQPDGTIMETALFRYINHPESGLVQRDAIEDLGDQAENERRKNDLIVRKLQLEVDRAQFAHEKELGEHIHRADLEMEIISRAVALRATLKNWIHFTAERWIRLKTAAQLTEDMEQGLDQALNDFANTKRYHVIFADDDTTDLQDD